MYYTVLNDWLPFTLPSQELWVWGHQIISITFSLLGIKFTSLQDSTWPPETFIVLIPMQPSRFLSSDCTSPHLLPLLFPLQDPLPSICNSLLLIYFLESRCWLLPSPDSRPFPCHLGVHWTQGSAVAPELTFLSWTLVGTQSSQGKGSTLLYTQSYFNLGVQCWHSLHTVPHTQHRGNWVLGLVVVTSLVIQNLWTFPTL